MQNIPENYKKVTELSQMQDMLRRLMHQFHCLCEKHGLVYNMWFGTLLGAVRHQDMIPWDDDIDICMPRDDYEKFIEIVQREYADQFEVHTYPKENYFYPFAKFCLKNSLLIEQGLKPQFAQSKLYIDVYPLDGLPSTEKKELQKRYSRVKRNQRFAAFCVAANDSIPAAPWKRRLRFLKPVLSAFFNIWGYRIFLEKQIEETTRFRFEDCEYVAFVSQWGEYERGIIRKSDCLDRVLYPFGEYAFWGPKNAHAWLANLYGDYMTPPPEDKRCAVHNYELYVEVND